MCGRYVLSMRPSVARQRLADQAMPADEAPDDEDDRIRPTYNLAPSYHGLIYRADTSDRGAGGGDESHGSESVDDIQPAVDGLATKETKYKLQAARWGLIPFWTKRAPDYASQMRTINCRDDSLLENRGMWNTMKQRKRCIVIAEGFYEWLKKNGGKEKIPHYTKRKDGQLMCFAGLWDMVQYEDSVDKLYTYTVITTDSNKQLKFLHDRMPVILEPGSDEMKAWLDPNRIGWDKELQSMLKPYEGELDCYPVDKAVGKVGNNSPSFLVPIDSKENKQNIANFFGTQRAPAKDVASKNEAARKEQEVMKEIKQDPEEHRETATKAESSEDNAPLPKPETVSEDQLSQSLNQNIVDVGDEAGTKSDEQVAKDIELDTAQLDDQAMAEAADKQVERGIKREMSEIDDSELIAAGESLPPSKAVKLENPGASPTKTSPAKTPAGKKTRNATSNTKNKVAKKPTTDGNAKITSFFGK